LYLLFTIIDKNKFGIKYRLKSGFSVPGFQLPIPIPGLNPEKRAARIPGLAIYTSNPTVKYETGS
jgi:hypothetical protein